jgi:ribosomal-protein-alanine N-acetyltransferase
MKVSIRPTKIEDVDAFLQIQTECGLSEWSGPAYRAEIGRTDSIVLTAEGDEGNVVGFITGRVMVGGGPVPTEGEIYNIGVRPPYRKAGAGSGLLRAFLKEARKAGAQSVWLDVRASNSDAIQFYSAHGFTVAGLRPKFYSQPEEDAKLMVNKLGETGPEQTG